MSAAPPAPPHLPHHPTPNLPTHPPPLLEHLKHHLFILHSCEQLSSFCDKVRQINVHISTSPTNHSIKFRRMCAREVLMNRCNYCPCQKRETEVSLCRLHWQPNWKTGQMVRKVVAVTLLKFLQQRVFVFFSQVNGDNKKKQKNKSSNVTAMNLLAKSKFITFHPEDQTSVSASDLQRSVLQLRRITDVKLRSQWFS